MSSKKDKNVSYEVDYNFKPIDPSELEFDLPFHMHQLLKDEPFFSRVSRYIQKVPNRSIMTAGVRLNPNTFSYELIYNPKFFLSLTYNERKWVLMHEFYHIALGHCTNRKADGVNQKKANIAMDEAINSLPNMIKDALSIAIVPGRKAPKEARPGSIAKLVENHLPGQAMEYYLNMLPEDLGEGDSFDDHSNWTFGDPDSAESEAVSDIASQKIKDVLQKAINECEKEAISNSNAWGTVSAEMRAQIKDFLCHKLDPKKVLSYFIKCSVRADKKHRITKINKRFPYIHPGRSWARRPKIAISIDQSGSVSDEMLTKFFSWLNEFSKFADFTVIPFDDRVFEEKIYLWKKNQKRTKERVLCGGTNFDAPTDYVNQNDFDAHIICTDLCAPEPKRSKVQRMWVTDKQCGTSRQNFSTNERILIVD